MVRVPLGLNAYKRTYANEPEVKLVNRYVEKDPSNLKEQLTLIGRAGTKLLSTFAGGTIRATFNQPGLFNGDLFVVSGATLYRYDGTTATPIYRSLSGSSSGIVDGSGNPSFAGMWGAAYQYLFIADGTGLYVYDGTTVSAVTMPGSVAAKSLAGVSGYVLVSVPNTQTVYFINPGEIIVGALNFFSKESQPDNVEEMLTVGDQVLIMGQASTENWYASGDSTAPFVPQQGRVYQRGVVLGTPVNVGDSVIFVGKDGRVYEVGYHFGEQAQWGVHRISTNGIEERIRTQLRREEGL